MSSRKEYFIELFTASGPETEQVKCLVIAGLISAESNTCRGERECNLQMLTEIRDALANVPGAEKYYNDCCKGIDILTREIESPDI